MDREFLANFMEKMQMDGELCDKFYRAIQSGNNKVYHNVISEAVTLDENWILTVDSALFSVEKIVKNPRKFITEEELVVDVERARRTNAKTVRHLASNSQYVQNVSRNGEVRPKKLLTTELQEDLAIYENRFVCALIARLVPFVEQRYREIVGQMDMYDQTGVGISSKFRYGKSDVECNIEIKVREQPHDLVLLEKNTQLLERVTQIRRRLKNLQNTEFMQQLSKKKPVRPPIMKTNLIKMNVDYQNCYKLWLFISSYSFVGFSVQFQDKNLPVDGDYYDDLTVLAGLSVQSLISNHVLNKETYEEVPFKEAKKKDYKVVTAYKFEPTFGEDKTQAGDEVVNEYYFKKMKDELVKATKRNKIVEEKEINMSFSRFVRNIAKINGAMYEDVMRSQTGKKEDLRRKTALEKKELAVAEQKVLLQRYRQLTKLKREELEKTAKMENREALKLKKLQAEFDKERTKQKLQEKKKAQAEKKASLRPSARRKKEE